MVSTVLWVLLLAGSASADNCVFDSGTKRFDLSSFAGVTVPAHGLGSHAGTHFNISVCGDLPNRCKDSEVGVLMPPGEAFIANTPARDQLLCRFSIQHVRTRETWVRTVLLGLLLTKWLSCRTCWDVLAHWKDLRVESSAAPVSSNQPAVSLFFSHFGDAHISCPSNVSVQVDLTCDPHAPRPVGTGGQTTGCNWQFEIKTADKAICNPGTSATLESAVASLLAVARKQANRTASILPTDHYPSSTSVHVPSGQLNKWNTGGAAGWTAGFFPGLLWKLFKATGEQRYMTYALEWTEGLRSQQHNTHTHDVGFMIFDSFGQGLLAAAGDKQAEAELKSKGYHDVVINAAHSLATRYNPVVGCTQSWPSGHHCRADPSILTAFPVIIDNMMNLELLFFAANSTGNSTLHGIAESHANKTAENHVRDDGSTFHVVDYNASTGAVEERCTAQGLNDQSTWSRGQSWCIYGFTMSYRFSRQQLHLTTAQKCADFWLERTATTGDPNDGVPLWDFSWSSPQTRNFRDTSAAAIAASAMLELSGYVEDNAKSQAYRSGAERILVSLGSGSDYLGEYDQTEGVLTHASGANPAWSPDNFNVSLIYGGYFVTEAAQRWAGMIEQETSF